MHTQPAPFPAIEAGLDLGARTFTISAEANDRYWRGAGIEHPARSAGLLYPPMAVNLTILLVQQTEPQGFLHTRERMRCLGTASAPCEVTVTGAVVSRSVKRERTYFVVASQVSTAEGELLWESHAELCSPQRQRGAADVVEGAPLDWGPDLAPVDGGARRTLALSHDMLRAYSRAGNFHSDDEAAREMGLTGMVAMGMQTTGPAIGLALDAWGDEFVRTGGLDAKFFGMVGEGETIEARVALDADAGVAEAELRNVDQDRPTGLLRLTRNA